MAFNLTSWKTAGRNFGRGSPPPRGSIEWIGVGDMFYTDPEQASRLSGNYPPQSQTKGEGRRPSGRRPSGAFGSSRRPGTSVGAQATSQPPTFTELDAAKNWINTIDRSVRQARMVHGDQILSKQDESDWLVFMTKWRAFSGDVRVSGHTEWWGATDKQEFNELLEEAHKLADRFTSQRSGRRPMSIVPVPYMGELLELLRSMPKRMTASQMQAKLLAGVKCGQMMLDQNMTWFKWIVSNEHRPLKIAINDASAAAEIYGRSRTSGETYSPGDAVYDEFLRRLTKIWIEAAGLYGIRQVEETAAAELKDDIRQMPKLAIDTSLWLLGLAGVAYLGLAWFAGHRSRPIVVGVPDAYPAG